MIKAQSLIVLGQDNPANEGSASVYRVLKDFDLKVEYAKVGAKLDIPIRYTVLVDHLIDHLAVEGYIEVAEHTRHVLWGNTLGSATDGDLEDFYNGEQYGKG